MLTARQLTKRFAGDSSVDAACDVSFNIEQGEFLAIVGRSGSGKSTLLGMLGGISQPSSGSVVVDGIDQWQLNDDALSDFRNRKIGFVFQFASLLPTLRAIDNVALPALVGGTLNNQEAYARARLLLQRVGLAARTDSYPGQLSGGEQRRVAIARALINSPDLLLADEPTADLDGETEEEILSLLIDIHRAFNLTLVVVTHNPGIAARADRVLTMRAGQGALSASAAGSTAANADDPTVLAGSGDYLSADAVRDLNRIYQNSPEAAAAEKVRLGEGIERLVGKFVIWAVPLIVLGLLFNVGLRTYELNMLETKAAERQSLETLAINGVRADVKDVVMAPGKSYLVTLYLRNTTDPERPVYVMAPAVRGFVQIGSSWQEVPLKPVQAQSVRVIKLTGMQTFQYLLEPDVQDFAQLIPYYMHVRIANDMLVSPSAQPKNDLVERNDNYYVYLKPKDVSDKAILTKLKFPDKPPVWIPMPPH